VNVGIGAFLRHGVKVLGSARTVFYSTTKGYFQMSSRPVLPPDISSRRETASGPSRSVCRALASFALGELRREDPKAIAKAAWPSDVSTEMLVRSTISPTSTASAGVADLLGAGVSILTVAPQAAASRLFSKVVRLDFSGKHTLGVISPSTIPSPSFYGEGLPFPVAQLDFSTAVVGPIRKFAVACVVTREIENAAPEAASAIISRALSGKAATNFDAVAFDTNAADSVRPAGLLHSISDLGSTAGGGVDALVGDISKIVANAQTSGANVDELIFIGGAQAAIKLRLLAGPRFNYEILSSTGLEDDTLIGVIPSGIYFGGQDASKITVKKDATLVMEDSAVEPVSTGGTVAQSVRSVFQTDSFLVTLKQDLVWGSLTSGAVSLIEEITW
jgi:hypothetical protein